MEASEGEQHGGSTSLRAPQKEMEKGMLAGNPSSSLTKRLPFTGESRWLVAVMSDSKRKELAKEYKKVANAKHVGVQVDQSRRHCPSKNHPLQCAYVFV